MALREIEGRAEDEVLKLRFIGGPKAINRPGTYSLRPENLLAPGETFEATWLWVRQRWPFWLAGYFAEDPSASTKAPGEQAAERCAGVTKSGAQCKRKPLEGSDFCPAHAPE